MALDNSAPTGATADPLSPAPTVMEMIGPGEQGFRSEYGAPPAPPSTEDQQLDVLKAAVQKEYEDRGYSFTQQEVDDLAGQLMKNADATELAQQALDSRAQATSVAGQATLGSLPGFVHSVMIGSTQDDTLNGLGLQFTQRLGGTLTRSQKNILQYGSSSGPLVDPLRDYEVRMGIDPDLNAVHSGAASLWESYFGRKPTAAEMAGVLAHGADAQTQEDYIRSLPSHVPGMSLGAYTDGKKAADAAVQKFYGHPAADSIVADLFNQGIRSAGDIENWVYAQGAGPANGMNPALYKTEYQAHVAPAQGLYNDVPDFRDVVQTAQAAHPDIMQPPPPATTQQSQQQVPNQP